MQQQYQILKQQWGGYAGYDRWFGQQPGNAHLVSVATYHAQVPAWLVLLQQSGSFAAFYQAAAELAKLPPEARAARFAALGQQAQGQEHSPDFIAGLCSNSIMKSP